MRNKDKSAFVLFKTQVDKTIIKTMKPTTILPLIPRWNGKERVALPQKKKSNLDRIREELIALCDYIKYDMLGAEYDEEW